MTCWVLGPFFGKANRGAADEFSANKETTDGDGLGSSATGFGCFSLFAGLAIGGSGLLCLGWERESERRGECQSTMYMLVIWWISRRAMPLIRSVSKILKGNTVLNFLDGS
nr:hypothetical protein Iba_chr04eCG17730 [Ipomoea batatas]